MYCKYCGKEIADVANLCPYCGKYCHSPIKVTNTDLLNGVADGYGVVYSSDGRRLLKCSDKNIHQYRVKAGTKFICDSAFWKCENLTSVRIPNSVTSFGESAFFLCESLEKVYIRCAADANRYSVIAKFELLPKELHGKIEIMRR